MTDTYKIGLSVPSLLALGGALVVHGIFLVGICMLTPEEYYRLGSGHPLMIRQGVALVRRHVPARARHAGGPKTKMVEVVYQLPEDLQGVFDALGLGVVTPTKASVKKPTTHKQKAKKPKAVPPAKKPDKKQKKSEPIKQVQKQAPVVPAQAMPVRVAPEQVDLVKAESVDTKVVVIGRDKVPAVTMPRSGKTKIAQQAPTAQSLTAESVTVEDSGDGRAAARTGQEAVGSEVSGAGVGAGAVGAGNASYAGYGEGDGQYAAFGDLVDITGSGSGEALSDEQYEAVLELHEVLQQNWSPPVRCSDEPIEVELTIRHDGTLTIDTFKESAIPAVNFAVKRLLLTTIPEQLLHKVGGLRLKLHLKA